MINKKLTCSVIACVLGVTFSTASLALSWDTCGIQRVGVTGATGKLVKVTACEEDSTNSGKWLSITNQPNASLATVLSALGMAKKLKLHADFASGSANGTTTGAIETMYLDQ